MTCRLQPPTQNRLPQSTKRMSAGVRCFSGQGAALELAARARRAALVVVGLPPIQWHYPSKKPLSFGARPWYDVPATTSNANPAAAREPSARTPALAASREKAQHSSLLRGRTVPRWLWPVHAL